MEVPGSCLNRKTLGIRGHDKHRAGVVSITNIDFCITEVWRVVM